MRSDVLQTGLLLNPVQDPPQQRTYVAFGTRRGGTSPVAGIMRALGVDLGRIEGRTNNEDPDFQNRPSPHMRKAISERDGQRDVWGWKFPGAGTYLPEIAAALRNPFYVVVFRDPVAAAMSQARLDRQVNRRTSPVALHESNANSNTNMGFVLASGRPCLLISNEKARERPGVLVDELADFLFVERPTEEGKARILEYLEPGTYKSFEEFFGAAAGGAAGTARPS